VEDSKAGFHATSSTSTRCSLSLKDEEVSIPRQSRGL
jgi:hypothetical protein